MKIRAQAAMSAASILLVAGAAGCGGGDSGSAGDAPDGASKSDFCAALTSFETNLSKVDPTSDPKSIAKTFKDEATKLRGVGTPGNLPDDARAGYDAALDAIDKLPEDATLDDLNTMEDGLTAADEKNSNAFEAYLKKECPDLDTGS